MPSGLGYALEGNVWPSPSLITYSVVPDGTVWDYGTRNLQAALNTQLGKGVWEYQIAKALATWESVANINIAPVADSGAAFNTYGLDQGDPRFGDIRIAGYNLNNGSIAAQTYEPPPQGWTAGGDSELNTALAFAIGSGIDLYSIVLHEMGHAPALAHSPDASNVMYASYEGVRTGLGPGDIAGIDALYGPRSVDSFI